MNPKSAEALVGLAIITDILALTVMSPTAWFGLSVVAAVLALIPAVFARNGRRIAGLVVLALSIAQAAWAYPAHEKLMARYLEHAKKQADQAKAPAPPPAAQKQ